MLVPSVWIHCCVLVWIYMLCVRWTHHPFVLSLQVCTAVIEQRLHTARRLVGGSFVPWAQSTRSWRVWLISVAPSLSPRSPCGSVSWAALTLPPPLRWTSLILLRWTVQSCTAAPRPTPLSAGRACWHPQQGVSLCFTFTYKHSAMCSDRDMCQEISTNWGSQTWHDFDQLCEYNPVETELINCLADVREPCQLGCKDLSYCTNFNNRSGSWTLTGFKARGVLDARFFLSTLLSVRSV